MAAAARGGDEVLGELRGDVVESEGAAQVDVALEAVEEEGELVERRWSFLWAGTARPGPVRA
ncbi:hypothetical protein ACFY4B_42150 [Kitasatospora sp. NPDC001261]|uniref:hypothetical protein n=1 Tax=Kitasatospora sp. NPDC001261 TaxID=3364012 RepID=UPI00367F5C59